MSHKCEPDAPSLTSLILHEPRVYGPHDIERAARDLCAKRVAEFALHIDRPPNQRGAPVLVVWPRGAVLFAREHDIRNDQALSIAWARAASGIPSEPARRHALCLPPVRGRGFENVAFLPPRKGEA